MAYIGRPLQVANLAVQSGTGDGSDTTPIATLDYATTTNGVAVYLDGVRQLAGTDFNVTSQTTLTFTTAPANGVGVDVYFLGLELSLPTPADATVTSAKIVDGAILNADVNASAAIEGGKLNLNTGTGNAKLTSSSQATTTLLLEQATGAALSPSTGVVLQLQRDDTTGRSCELSIIGGNAGQSIVNFGDANDEDIGNITYSHNTNVMDFYTNAAKGMTISSDGEVTKPLQPCFCAYASGAQSNVTGNGAEHTVIFATERFDQGGNFDGTSTFTAPVAGRYLLATTVQMVGLTSGTVDDMTIKIVTSNQSYDSLFYIVNMATTQHSLKHTIVCDMDASDTAVVKVIVNGESSDIADINVSAGRTVFSGCLLA